MVVLNCYGIIEPQCISEKLNLYVSNLPSEGDYDWRSELIRELVLGEKIDNLSREQSELSIKERILELYTKVFPNKRRPNCVSDGVLDELADNMVCLYLDREYEYDNIIYEGEAESCFVERSCEDDPLEKLVDFINFLSHSGDKWYFPSPTPQWIYSSNRLRQEYHRLFWGGEPAHEYIKCLKEWGALFDAMLADKKDFMLLDYIFNSIHKDHNYNEYHLFKSYSLCQLFLEKEQEIELDEKLPLLMEGELFEQGKERACIMRRLRNKVAHGDFAAFDKELENYASKFMDGSFWFDYYEYSRRNWTILHVCCELDDIVRKLVYLLFHDREKLKQIKASGQ